jgi:hypothetical protein
LARAAPERVAIAGTLLVRTVLARTVFERADLVTRPREAFDRRGALDRFVIAIPDP